MDLSALKPAFEHALCAKLVAVAQEYSNSRLRRLDIGVFPWHGTIELSLLFSDENYDENCIADWPHYDVSQFSEGKWPEAVACCNEMRRLWEANPSLSKAFFQLVAEAAGSQKVQSAIESIKKTEGFEVTLFDPDDNKSGNYVA